MNYTFRLAETHDERLAAYRLRYETFVQEKGWWSAPEDALERDQWDDVADLFVALDNAGDVVGTSRTIPDSSIGFQFDELGLLPSSIERHSLVEVSRMAVLPDHRKQQSAALLGLCAIMCDIKLHEGYPYWGGLIVVSLVRLLERVGINFHVKSEPFRDYGAERRFVIASMAQTHQCLFQSKVAPHTQNFPIPAIEQPAF